MNGQVFEQKLSAYGSLLSTVDDWFNRCTLTAGKHITCHTGCSGCCRGLFDITLLDAWYLSYGFRQLEPVLQERVLEKCRVRLSELQILWPELEHPYILNNRPDEDWEDLMPEEDETPCVLLSEKGACLAYEYRPMTCRLHGIPLIDISGELLYDGWCTLNFIDADPIEMPQLQWEFNNLFSDELAQFQSFTEAMLNHRINELDTFIPLALLIDFDCFDWPAWWSTSGSSYSE